MSRAIRVLPVMLVLFIAVLFVAGCTGARYSDDPVAARVQGLTDFCIGYGAMRDAMVYMIEVDKHRTTPVLTLDAVVAFDNARTFIRPFCAPEFDPLTDPFSLKGLEIELKKIRLLLLERENA